MEEITFNFLLFAFTWTGAFCGHVLSLSSSSKYVGTSKFLQNIIPGRNQQFYVVLDTLLLPIVGGFLAYMLAGPETARTSVVCGLTWSGSVTAVIGSR